MRIRLSRNDRPSPDKTLRTAAIGCSIAVALAAAGCGSKRENARLVSEKAYLATENRRVMDALEAKNVETRGLEVARLRLEAQNKDNDRRIASLEAVTVDLRRSLKEKQALAGELDRRVRELSATVKTQAARLRESDAALHESEARLALMTQDATASSR